MPGGLCCYCRVPRGVTLRCAHPDCCESFHFLCHWRSGGFCELRDAEIYIGGGKHPRLFALCFKHMPHARRAALLAEALLRAAMQPFSRGSPAALHEALQRLDAAGMAPNAPGFAANSTGFAANSASLAANAAASGANSAQNSANSGAKTRAKPRTGSRLGSPREICHVCGFGYSAPPINQEMVLEGSRFGRFVNIRRDDSAVPSAQTTAQTAAAAAAAASKPVSTGTSSTSTSTSSTSPAFSSQPNNPRGSDDAMQRTMTHLAETLQAAGQRVDCGSGVYLQPGSRGNMLHCAVCGTVVHEVCADLPRIQVLAQFDHCKCTVCGRFIARLRLLGVSAGLRRTRAPSGGLSARRAGQSRARAARVLRCVRRPHWLLRADRGRRFGAQKVRIAAARIRLFHSPLPDDDRNRADFPVPQRRGAHAGAVRAALHRLHGAAVQRDVGIPAGSQR